MQDSHQRQVRKYIIAGFAIFSLIIAGLTALLFQSTRPASNNPNQNAYQDPASGEMVLKPEGKVPETYGTNPNTPIYLGLTALLDIGLGYDQLTLLKSQFNDFAYKSTDKITEVSLKKDSLIQTQNASEQTVYTFTTIINRKEELKATVTAPDVTSTQLVLQKGDKQIFSSQ